MIKIRYSQPEGDAYRPSIAAFFLRLVCTNGMISKTEVSASYRYISLKIPEKFPEVLGRVSFELGRQKSHFRISLSIPLPLPRMH
jgi:hypothetical protein